MAHPVGASAPPFRPGEPGASKYNQWNKAGKKLVAFILEYQKAMFVEIYRSRWTEELAELDRLIDRNLEQVLEQRYLLAGLDDGREANLIEKFGDEYRQYMKRTGRYLPKLGGRS